MQLVCSPAPARRISIFIFFGIQVVLACFTPQAGLRCIFAEYPFKSRTQRGQQAEHYYNVCARVYQVKRYICHYIRDQFSRKVIGKVEHRDEKKSEGKTEQAAYSGKQKSASVFA